jgi:hypothetical protein
VLALVLAELTPAWKDWQDALKGWNMRESQTVLGWKNEALQETLQDQLKARFGPLPPDLVQKINALKDTEKLKAALIQVLSIEGPEELEL